MNVSLAILVLGLMSTDADVPDASMDTDGGSEVERTFTVGEKVSRTFYVSSGGDAGIFGVDFAIDCKGTGLRIASVEFSPDFPKTMGGKRIELPATKLHTVRTQSPRRMDRTLGAGGIDVPFATVEFETLTDGPFKAEAAVCSRVSLIGNVAQKTVVLGGDSRGSASRGGENKIQFQSTWNSDAWTSDARAVTLELIDESTGLPTDSLTVGQNYSVRYAAGAAQVTDYSLVVISDAPGNSVRAQAAADGRWLRAGHFTVSQVEDEIQAEGFAQGYQWRQVISDFVWPKTDAAATGLSQGTICTMTPTRTGDLHLQLNLKWLDPETREIVEMETVESFHVQDAP